MGFRDVSLESNPIQQQLRINVSGAVEQLLPCWPTLIFLPREFGSGLAADVSFPVRFRS